MKIAIISDIHENFHNLLLALKKIKELEAEKIICLGDLMNNGIAKVLSASEIPVFTIWGNNDGDKVAITKTSLTKNSNMKVSFETFDFMEIDNRKIFLTHYPVLAKPMAKSGDFDAVFYGHDHKQNIDKVGDCIVVNPGELSAHKTKTSKFAMYDTKDNSAEIIELDNSLSVKTDEVTEHMKKIHSIFPASTTFGSRKTHEY